MLQGFAKKEGMLHSQMLQTFRAAFLKEKFRNTGNIFREIVLHINSNALHLTMVGGWEEEGGRSELKL